jgi:hypothetical protein
MATDQTSGQLLDVCPKPDLSHNPGIIPKPILIACAQFLLASPDERLALGGDDADVSVGGGAVGHAPGAEAAGEGEDADDGVGPDLAGPDLEVVGAADAVDLEIVDGGGESAAGGLDGSPACV